MAISQFRARRTFIIVASLGLSEYRKANRSRQCKCCKSAPETDDDSRRTRLVGSRLREQSGEDKKRHKSEPRPMLFRNAGKKRAALVRARTASYLFRLHSAARSRLQAPTA